MGDQEVDEELQLSAHTLAALQEFYAEQKAVQEQNNEEQVMPQEKWNLSQFWYSDETASRLAKEVMAVIGNHGRVACVSCPTLYHKLLELKPSTAIAKVLEYDKTFEKFGEDFVFYDYNHPLDLPKEMERQFDLVVADPPHLSEDCLTRTSQTIQFLTKEKVLLCTGAVMEELAGKLLNAKPVPFLPKHNKNLSNPFRCYTNYASVTLNDTSS